MNVVYIASPYAGDIEYNTTMAIQYCRYAAEHGTVPLAPHLLLPRFLCESNPAERELGIKMGLSLIALCSELWVFGGRITTGMSREIAEAKRLGIPTKYISEIEMTGVKEMKKYGIWAKRNAVSVCGAGEAWFKEDGKPMSFDTYEAAAAKADSLMKKELEETPSFGVSMKL